MGVGGIELAVAGSAVGGWVAVAATATSCVAVAGALSCGKGVAVMYCTTAGEFCCESTKTAPSATNSTSATPAIKSGIRIALRDDGGAAGGRLGGTGIVGSMAGDRVEL